MNNTNKPNLDSENLEVSEELANKVSMRRWFLGLAVFPKFISNLLLTLSTLVCSYGLLYLYWDQATPQNFIVVRTSIFLILSIYSSYFFTQYYSTKKEIQEMAYTQTISFFTKYLVASRLFFISIWRALLNTISLALFFISWVLLDAVYNNYLYEMAIINEWNVSIMINTLMAMLILFLVYPFAVFLIWKRVYKEQVRVKLFFAFALSNITSMFISFAILFALVISMVFLGTILQNAEYKGMIFIILVPVVLNVYFHYLQTELIDTFEKVNEDIKRLNG